MNKKSIKVNAFLNIIKTLMSVIFPLITFPYASRILLPEGIGKVQFALSIISYFSLLATLGITSYGVREGAKYRDSRGMLSIFAKEIFVINLCSTVFSYLLLIIAIMIVPKFFEYKSLLIVCSSSILFTALGMEWLYTAVEDFKYITIRSIIFQFLSLVLLFAFVHSEEDVLAYAAISVFSNVGSNVFNFFNSKKYITFKGIKVRFENIKKHIGPVMILFVMAVTSSIYTILDTSMIGFYSNDYQVGIYTAATKINRIVLNLVVSIGAVLLPRLSYYSGTNDKESFLKLAYKSADLILALSVPATIGLTVLSNSVIEVISGAKYAEASPVMKIINPIIIIVGMSNFIGVQLFMPLKKEKWTLYSDIIGAVCNLSINVVLIPTYGVLGAAVASVIAELAVTTTQLILSRKYISISTVMIGFVKYLVMGIIMGFAVYLVNLMNLHPILNLIIGIMVGVIVYCSELIITKNQWANLGISMIRGKLYGNKKDS